jgi:hypothetical protein
MNPLRKRALDLFVSKNSIFVILRVQSFPRIKDWSGLHFHDHFCAGLNPAFLADDDQGIPRRAEAQNGAGPGVPFKHFFNRRFYPGFFFEYLHCDSQLLYGRNSIIPGCFFDSSRFCTDHQNMTGSKNNPYMDFSGELQNQFGGHKFFRLNRVL